MNSRKLILAIIIVLVLFIIFLGLSFGSIQRVNMDVEFEDDMVLSDHLKSIAERLTEKLNTAYLDDISLKDMKINMMLVDHIGKSACFVIGDEVHPLDYEKLDAAYINCNSYFLTTNINKRPTIIINCDEILGEPVARCIAAAYHYKYAKVNILSPERVEYFITENQDMDVSYYRYWMIESAKQAYFNNADMDELYHFYIKYAETLGENEHREAINYDFHDGLKEYIYIKVLSEDNEDFDLYNYIEQYKNEYSIYSKDDEYKAMGLMLCLLLEREGISITQNSTKQGEWYKLLLRDTPLGDADEKNYTEYQLNFIKYQKWVIDTIDTYKVNAKEPIDIILFSEKYENTIKADDYYIYVNYAGRKEDLSVLQTDYLIVRIDAYKIEYYN